jgi:hypothetical protein
MAIKKVLSFSDWLDSGYNEPKGDNFKDWNRTAKAMRAERIAMVADICDVSTTTVLNLELGNYGLKDYYLEAIVSLAGQPLVFMDKKNKDFLLVTLED